MSLTTYLNEQAARAASGRGGGRSRRYGGDGAGGIAANRQRTLRALLRQTATAWRRNGGSKAWTRGRQVPATPFHLHGERHAAPVSSLP